MIARATAAAVAAWLFACLAVWTGSESRAQWTGVSNPIALGSVKKVLTSAGHETVSAGCTSPCTINKSGSHYSIGPALSNRYVLAIVFAQASGVTASAMTLCGQSGIIPANANKSSNASVLFLATALVISGTTCDLVATFNTNPSRYGAQVWYSTGLSSPAANDSAGTTSCTTCSTTVTALNGGFILAGGASNNAATFSWSVVSQIYSDTCATNACQFSAASLVPSTGGSKAVQFTGGGGVSNAVAASF